MEDCHPSTTLIHVKNRNDIDNSDMLCDPSVYRSLVGKLQYLTFTRHEISYAVNVCSQYMSKPILNNFKMLKRIIRYLKGTINFGI